MNFIKELSEDQESTFINRALDSANGSIIVDGKKSINLDKDNKFKDFNKAKDDEFNKLLTDDILIRQAKTRLLLEKIDIVDSKIDSIKNTLLSQISEFEKSVNIEKDPLVLKAVRKIFKKNTKVITKDMYLEACARLQNLQNKSIEIK